MADNDAAKDPVARDVGHTAEVELVAQARSFAELLAAAGRGLAELSLGGPLPVRPGAGEWRRIEVQGTDQAALLVNWLNELIYLGEVDRWVATEFQIEGATETAVRAMVRGVTVETPPSRVKAATLHGLAVVTRDARLEARIILDV